MWWAAAAEGGGQAGQAKSKRSGEIVEGAVKVRCERGERVHVGALAQPVTELVGLAPEVTAHQADHLCVVAGGLPVRNLDAELYQGGNDAELAAVVRIDQSRVGVVARLQETRIRVSQLRFQSGLAEHSVDRVGGAQPGGRSEGHTAGENGGEETCGVAHHEPARSGDRVRVVAVVGLHPYLTGRGCPGRALRDSSGPAEVLGENFLRIPVFQY